MKRFNIIPLAVLALAAACSEQPLPVEPSVAFANRGVGLKEPHLLASGRHQMGHQRRHRPRHLPH